MGNLPGRSCLTGGKQLKRIKIMKMKQSQSFGANQDKQGTQAMSEGARRCKTIRLKQHSKKCPRHQSMF
jgi:hypothetical protein